MYDKNDDNVLFGVNDYLFLKNDTNRVIDQITGKFLLTSREVIYWRNIILQRNLLFKYFNINYKFIVAPNKEVICRRYLPSDVQVSDKRPVTQIVNSLNLLCYKNFFYKDDFNDIELSYPKGETHWCDIFAYNYFGLAMNGLIKILDSHELDVFTHTPQWFDLGSKVQDNYKEELIRLRPKFPKSKLIFTNGVTNMGRVDVYESSSRNLPVALIFRDSFFTNLLDLVAESFSKVIYIWHPWIDWELIETHKPNFVINASVERFLTLLPDDIAGPSHLNIINNKTVG